MSTTSYNIGDLVRIYAVFSNSVGTAIDPSVVKFQYLAAAIGVATTYTYGVDAALVKAATGSYYVNIDTNESAGGFSWRFYSTGTGQGATMDTFYVRPNITTVVP